MTVWSTLLAALRWLGRQPNHGDLKAYGKSILHLVEDSMQAIHSDQLWIGHALDIREPRALMGAGISAIVDVAFEETPAQPPRQLIYCRFPIIDGGGNAPSTLLHAVQCVVDLLASGTRSIVACSAGMSRSPTIGAYGIAKHSNQIPEDVIAKIAETKALEINGQLWSDVAAVYSQLK